MGERYHKRCGIRFFDGTVAAIEGIVSFLYGTGKFLVSGLVFLMYESVDCKPPEWAEENVDATVEGWKKILQDPFAVVEGLGQQATDSIEEEGLWYCGGYVAGTTVGVKVAVKGVKTIKGGTGDKIRYEYLDEQLGSLKDKVKINQYQSAESINAWWKARGYKSPYKEKTVVQNITLTENTKFVRVYDGANSYLEGGWVMRAEDIKGLTSKEIQAKFALEYEPKFIGEVELKVGDTIRLGEVGPNFGFDGGGIQIDLQQQWVGDFTELGKIEDWR